MGESLTFAGHDDRTPLAIAAGLVAALLAGAGWAVLVITTNYEIGWAAWGVGALVGVAMTKVTVNRSRQLGMIAAVLALVGLLAGKAFVHVGSTGALADELVESPEYLAGPVAWDMHAAEELEPATMEAIRAGEEAGDTLSDALWADMLEQGSVRVAAMTADERRAVARMVAESYMGQMGLVDGVAVQLSGFDLLWLVLALGTAFQMMGPQKAAAPVAVEPEEESAPKEPVA